MVRITGKTETGGIITDVDSCFVITHPTEVVSQQCDYHKFRLHSVEAKKDNQISSKPSSIVKFRRLLLMLGTMKARLLWEVQNEGD